MTTRAGATRYDRPFAEAFIRPGLDPARWGNRANYVAQNVLQTGPAELSIYHRSGDRYVLRPDGFASLRAGAQGGTALTKPLIFRGRDLALNFSGAAAGGVAVELLAADGRVLAASERLVGDALERVVAWQDGAGAAIGAYAARPVRLRFTLQDADLYALRFVP